MASRLKRPRTWSRKAAARAVAYAHGEGVVHRDLKPDNIMVGAFGETVVLDWGIAGVRGQADVPSGAARPRGPDSLTHDGAVMGTPGYMAPEQARGDLDAIGPASDVWSLGAILYELVTGTPAVTGLDSQHKLAQSADLAEELMLTTAELSYLPDRRTAYENLAARTEPRCFSEAKSAQRMSSAALASSTSAKAT